MKKVLIAIERLKFNYLYKYDEIIVSNTNILHFGIDELIKKFKNNIEETASLIEPSLPIFEREDEILLIEVDAYKINFNLTFHFEAVLSIIPLNHISKQLLETKLNNELVISNSLPEILFEEIFKQRELKQRTKLGREVLLLFALPNPKKHLQSSVLDAITLKLLNFKDEDKSIFYQLLSFDSTPSGIPSGNIEGLMKVICLGLLKATGNMDRLRKSPLYNYLLENHELINNGDLEKSYNTFKTLIKSRPNLVEKLNETIDIEGLEGDSFKTFYYYFLLKNTIQKSEGNLKSWVGILNNHVISESELALAMYLVVLTVSFKEIHESYQKIRNSKLFGEQQTNNPLVIYTKESLVINDHERIGKTPSVNEIIDKDSRELDKVRNNFSSAEDVTSQTFPSNDSSIEDVQIEITNEVNLSSLSYKSDTGSNNLDELSSVAKSSEGVLDEKVQSEITKDLDNELNEASLQSEITNDVNVSSLPNKPASESNNLDELSSVAESSEEVLDEKVQSEITKDLDNELNEASLQSEITNDVNVSSSPYKTASGSNNLDELSSVAKSSEGVLDEKVQSEITKDLDNKLNEAYLNSLPLIDKEPIDRVSEIENFEKEIKGTGKKDVQETITKLYQENKFFTNEELENRLKKNEKLKTPGGKQKKIIQDTLKLFTK